MSQNPNSPWSALPLFPPQASSVAHQVDTLYFFLVATAAVFAIGIFLTLAVFAVKYRRSKHPVAEQIEGSLALELTWTFIPLCIAMVMFVWGASLYYRQSRPPAGAIEVYGVGKQWMWKFQHMDGQREINELHVPVNRDVKVILTSEDVIHDFFVPAFRVKVDVLPGPNRYTVAWFRPTRLGEYHLFCSQYCGTHHAGMIGTIIVMEPAQYETWLSGGASTESLASQGEKLFAQLGCNTCHRNDALARGPNLNNLFGQPVKLSDGSTVTADEGYIRESILDPAAKIVQGFQNIMPSFKGQISEEQLTQLVEYVKSLAPRKAPQPKGAPATAASAGAGAKPQGPKPTPRQ